MKICCIYARVSSELSDVDNSISAQISACKEYALKQGYRVSELFIDKAESGRTDKRPEFQRMIRSAKNKEFDIILIHKLDRFSRSREDAVTYKALLKKHKIELFSVTEKLKDDIYSQLIEGILEVTAEFYSKNLGEEIRKGKKEIIKRGYWSGGIPPYGYKIKKENNNGQTHSKLIPGEDASIIIELFARAARGERFKDLLKYLNNSSLKPFFSDYWRTNTLRYILENRSYIGESIFNGNIVKNNHEPLISEETFQKVQQQKKQNQGQKSNALIYPLSGISFCSDCGYKLYGSLNAGKRYYRCNNYSAKQKCTAKVINADKIEQKIKKILKTKLRKIQFIENLDEYKSEENITEKQIKLQLQNLDREQNNIINAIAKGLAVELFTEKLETIKQERIKLTEELKEKEREEKNKYSFDKEYLLNLSDIISKATPQELKVLYRHLIQIEFNLIKKEGKLKVLPFQLEINFVV